MKRLLHDIIWIPLAIMGCIIIVICSVLFNNKQLSDFNENEELVIDSIMSSMKFQNDSLEDVISNLREINKELYLKVNGD